MLVKECSTDTNNCQAIFRQAESSAYPAVFRGLTKAWPALQHWEGLAGLRHLQAAAGDATVQAMYARSSEFFGDIQQHTSVECSFQQLLELAEQQQQQRGLSTNSAAAGHTEASSAAAAPAAAGSNDTCCPNLYLAQQSLQEPGLSRLLEDVPVPELLQEQQMTAIHMWFSSRCSRSSLHYDPYQNLLCVVTGRKHVRIYPPAATLGLYPRALGGEASNHSSVNFARPDLEQHPLYRHVQGQCISVSLQPGDALFLPEGWWHQVDSTEMTFAVNFWWSSHLTTQLRAQSHQHQYYLRQLLASTSSEAVQQLLEGVQPWQQQQQTDATAATDDAGAGQQQQAGAAAAAADAGVERQQQQLLDDMQPWQQPDAAAASAGCGVERQRQVPGEGVEHVGGPDGTTDAAAARQSKRIKLHQDGAVAAAAAAGGEVGASQEPAQDKQHQQQQQQQQLVDLSSFETAALHELLQAAVSTQEHGAAMQQQQQQQPAGSAKPAAGDGGTEQAAVSGGNTLAAAGGSAVAAAADRSADAAADAGSADGSADAAVNAGVSHPAAADGSGDVDAPGLGASLLVDQRWWQQQAAAQQALLADSMQRRGAEGAISSSNGGGSGSSSSETDGSSCRSDEETSSGCSSERSSDSGRMSGGRCAYSGRVQGEQGGNAKRSSSSGSDRLGLSSRISRVLAALQPEQLLRVLWAASARHAAAVAQLLLHRLSPAAAQLLTERLEQADACFDEDTALNGQQQPQQQVSVQRDNEEQQQQAKEPEGSDETLQHGAETGKGCMPFSRAQFYGQLYGCVFDPAAVLAVMLAGKTRLTAAAADMITRVHMGCA